MNIGGATPPPIVILEAYKMYRVAGIDGSTSKTGVAIFEDGKYIEHILIDYHTMTKFENRFPLMAQEIIDYLSKWDVDKIIMEKSILKTNIDTVQKLSMLAGAIMFYANSHGIAFEYPVPSEWRKVIGLSQGRVKREILKAEAVRAVKLTYDLDLTDDEAEAILIARSGYDLPQIKVTASDVADEVWG